MVADLGTILRRSFQTLRTHVRPLFVGAVLFGTIVAIIATVANQRIEGHIWQGMKSMGVDQGQMLELRQRMQSGDPEAMQEVMASLGGSLEGMSDSDREALFAREAKNVARRVFPIIAIGMVGWAIVLLFAISYYLVMGSGKSKDPLELLRNSIFFAPRLLGTSLWMGIRSFIWIPILGLIPAFILAPRFVLAPVLALEKERHILRAVTVSTRATKGYWGKIVGNLLIMSIVVLLALTLSDRVIFQISVTAKVLGIWLHALMQQLLIAFSVVFTVVLATEIYKHPKNLK